MGFQYEYFDDFNGAKFVSLGNMAYAITSPNDTYSSGTYYPVREGDYAIGTGVYFVAAGDVYWAQTRSGMWINAVTVGSDYHWTAYKDAVAKVSYPQSDAQKFVNQIIECNKQIVANNILCARFANRLTSEQRKTLYDLQKRLETRNNSLLKDGLVQDVTTDFPQGYVYLQSYLESFMAGGGVGSVTVAIVIAAVVIASLSTAAYFAYKFYANEAEQDLKYSKSLTATLTSKLTDAEYKQLLDETKGILTKAKIRASLKGSNKVLLAIAAALGGYFIYERVTR